MPSTIRRKNISFTAGSAPSASGHSGRTHCDILCAARLCAQYQHSYRIALLGHECSDNFPHEISSIFRMTGFLMSGSGFAVPHHSFPTDRKGTPNGIPAQPSLRHRTSICNIHSLANFSWITTFGTEELNDSSLVLFGRILLERRHLTYHTPPVSTDLLLVVHSLWSTAAVL